MILEKLANIGFLRKPVIKTLKYFNFDIKIINPWSELKVFLNLFHHKGYWFYGKNREIKTMDFFKNQLKPGDYVIEVGGHIGWITQYFSKLVGDTGNVEVFEPGTNNLKYINKNTLGLKNTKVIQKAVSNHIGTASFYEDNITGQNNSLLENYKNADSVSRSHGIQLSKKTKIVEVTTLDEHLKSNGRVNVDLIKIDIEGCELQALQGAINTLKITKTLMVEVTENHEKVSSILQDAGFLILDEDAVELDSIPNSYNGNIFAVRNR
jgi:FkbM family methyltransferase